MDRHRQWAEAGEIGHLSNRRADKALNLGDRHDPGIAVVQHVVGGRVRELAFGEGIAAEFAVAAHPFAIELLVRERLLALETTALLTEGLLTIEATPLLTLDIPGLLALEAVSAALALEVARLLTFKATSTALPFEVARLLALKTAPALAFGTLLRSREAAAMAMTASAAAKVEGAFSATAATVTTSAAAEAEGAFTASAAAVSMTAAAEVEGGLAAPSTMTPATAATGVK
ncbi:MAG: hypothetical protein JOZ20_07810 [Sphingomonas sp.]|nr:hypothetical protein [Sphingomonas sp.]MBW0006944.1 hypothetical protein [Sphingomonas sp.]